jgi:hypothetical protein
MEQVPTSILCAERCHLDEGLGYDVATNTAWWSALARIDAERQLEHGRTFILDVAARGRAEPDVKLE